jgi:hypothetical protein
MNQPREMVFAGAAFSGNEKSRWHSGDFFREFKEAQRCRVVRDPRQALAVHG